MEISRVKANLKELLDPSKSVRHRLQISSLLGKICIIEDFLQRQLPTSQDAMIMMKRECLEDEMKEAIFELTSYALLGWVSEEVWPESMKKTKKKFDSIVKSIEKLINPIIKDEEIMNTIPPLLNMDEIVGVDFDLRMLIEDVTLEHPTKLRVVILFGMTGIGKTTLASILYDDPYIKEIFPTRIWVTITPGENQVRDIMFTILRSMMVHNSNIGDSNKMNDINEEMISDDQLRNYVRSELEGRKYLVVLDGVCEALNSNWEGVEELLFPENNNGSRIILTTRLRGVVKNCYTEWFCCDVYHLRLLDQNTSWDLLRKKVFVEEEEQEEEECKKTKSVCRELEDWGREIAWNCGGLPSAIVAAGKHLSKAQNMTVEYCRSVAENGNSFFLNAFAEESTIISVQMCLKQLLQAPDSSRLHSTRSQISSLYDNVCSLENMIETRHGNNGRRLLKSEIKEAIYEAKYCIEHCCYGWWESSFSQDLKRVMEKLNSIVKRMENSDINDTRSRLGLNVPPKIIKDEIVGLDQDLEMLKEYVKYVFGRRQLIAILGMTGIGKTTLASILYEDPFIKQEFPTRIWMKLSPKDGVRDVLQRLTYLSLENTKYFIVLDGVREEDDWWGKYKQLIPQNRNGSIIIQTTQLRGAARNVKKVHEMRTLGDAESWDLLRAKVFGKEECPRILQKFGRKIAENCQGLPIAIIAAAKHLSKAENKAVAEYWKSVVDSGNALISASEEGVYLRNMLYPSYQRLPERLKPFFLYMAVFPRHSLILVSKLVKLWVAEEGISMSDLSEQDALKVLQELVDRSVVLVRQKRSVSIYGIKSCVVPYVLWEICCEESQKEGFFHAANRYNDIFLEEEIIFPRNSDVSRLCIHNNVLLGFSEVRDAILDPHSTTIHSLLCIAPYHPYPLMQLSFGSLQMLKILDAHTIRLYTLPPEISELFQLKYLALTYGGGYHQLLSGLVGLAFNLKKLRFLIILRPPSTNSTHVIERDHNMGVAKHHLPMEIWGMPELKHLQVVGADLPMPDGTCSTVLLPQLSTLSDVSACSCTKDILQKLPNLKKLGVRIELLPHYQQNFDMHDHAWMHPFDGLSNLKSLESFKCAIVNPDFGSPQSHPAILSMPNQRSVFPNSLTKLTLSGCGFPWKDMNKIAQLPWLASLKLQCHAFRGPTWTVEKDGFSCLRFLLLEDLDVEQWTIQRGLAFRLLEHLRISHCYKLEGIPDAFEKFFAVKLIEVEDCNPLAIASSAQKIEERQTTWAAPSRTEICIHYSWDDKKKISQLS